MTEKYTDDPFSDLEAKARASREALKERLGDKMPVREKVAFSSDWDPCAGWFAAADLAYSLATGAEDILTAIKWIVVGDTYTTAGEGCQGLTSTLP